MVGPPGISATALAKETGISQSQLCRWRLKAVGRAVMAIDQQRSGEAKKWTPEEKFRVLVTAEGLKGEELGALLRREGLHEEQLRAWREAAAGALGAEAAASPVARAEERRSAAEAKKRVKELEKELRRKDKALAEAAAMLILEKKLQALGLGNGDGGTGERNDE